MDPCTLSETVPLRKDSTLGLSLYPDRILCLPKTLLEGPGKVFHLENILCQESSGCTVSAHRRILKMKYLNDRHNK